MTNQKQQAIETARETFRNAEDSYYFELRRLEWNQYPSPLTGQQKDKAWEEYALSAWYGVLAAENAA